MHDLTTIEHGSTPEQTDALERLLKAATDLVNAKLGAELAQTDFKTALQAGSATITLSVDLPTGNIRCTANYPALRRGTLKLFDVNINAPRLSS